MIIRAISAATVASFAALVLLHPLEAAACDPPPLPSGLIVPGWRASDVPLNVEPVVAQVSDGTTFDLVLPSLCEVDTSAQAVPVATSQRALGSGFSRLVPEALLQPKTVYVLRAAADCSGSDFGSFTTGVTEDTTPPEFPGVTAVVEDRDDGQWGVPVLVSGCGSPGYDYYRLDMPEPTDSAGGQNLMLLVYAGASAELVDLKTPAGALEVWDRRLKGPLGPEQRKDLAVVVTALDWAGNESAPQAPVVALGGACGCQGGGFGMAALGLLLLPALFRRQKAQSR